MEATVQNAKYQKYVMVGSKCLGVTQEQFDLWSSKSLNLAGWALKTAHRAAKLFLNQIKIKKKYQNVFLQ